MTIQQAIQSGKRFRRPGCRWNDVRGLLSFSVTDIMAEDWLIDDGPREWAIWVQDGRLTTIPKSGPNSSFAEKITVREVLVDVDRLDLLRDPAKDRYG